jgi:flagellar biosynthesis protein FlhF
MEPRSFHGPDLPRVLAAVRQAFGEDALVLRTRGPAETDGTNYEVVAAPGDAQLQPHRELRRKATRERASEVIALVGPPGAGKTTTLVKLALHPEAYGGRRVGLLTLDTYRAAGVEQLHVYAEIAELPLEVAYHAGEVEEALERLSDCEVILIDTPGRGMRGFADVEWRALLAHAEADEVHLVLPAGLRSDVATAARDAHAWCGTTHVLLTKLDEVPGLVGVRALKELLGLPARWTCGGPEVPHDLRAAAPAYPMHARAGVAV